MKKRKKRMGVGANLTAEKAREPMTPAAMARLLSGGTPAYLPEAGRGLKPAGHGTSRTRARVATALIRSHIAAGAPADERGRLSLVDYAAWLVRQGVSN